MRKNQPNLTDAEREQITSVFVGHMLHLQGEIASIRRRSNSLFRAGLVFYSISIFILTIASILYVAELNSSTSMQPSSLSLAHIVASASVGLIATFLMCHHWFCRREARYYNNELTNVAMKFVGLRAAMFGQEPDDFTYAARTLASTERNFILEKEQTTVDLAQAQLDQDSWHAIFKLFSSVVSNGTVEARQEAVNDIQQALN